MLNHHFSCWTVICGVCMIQVSHFSSKRILGLKQNKPGPFFPLNLTCSLLCDGLNKVCGRFTAFCLTSCLALVCIFSSLDGWEPWAAGMLVWELCGPASQLQNLVCRWGLRLRLSYTRMETFRTQMRKHKDLQTLTGSDFCLPPSDF